MYGQDDGLENSASFLDQGLIDSTGVLELVSFVEDKFQINVEDEEITPDNFDSVISLSNFVQSKMDN